VVGRDDGENQRLPAFRRDKDWLLAPEEGVAGPTLLFRCPSAGEEASPLDLRLAAGLIPLYCREGRQGGEMTILAWQDQPLTPTLLTGVSATPSSTAENWRIQKNTVPGRKSREKEILT
jgi:hypothetical protein